MKQQTNRQYGVASLPRNRLLARLEQAGQRKLALITAPGGYGKTTLVRQFMAQFPAAFCWVSLDPADASLPIFLQQLARAAAEHLPPGGLFSVAPEGAPTDIKAVRHLGRLVAAELGRHVEERLVIVLDDLHHVADGEQVMAFLDALLQHLPETVHLALVSRTRPYLPLARLEAQGEVIHLTATDLSFSAEEIEQFFAERFELKLPPELLAVLMAHTEGWVTALQLLGSLLAAMPRSEWCAFLSRFPEGGALFDFLAEEVFGHQPEELQEFLLGTCVLTAVQPAIAERMLGTRGAGAILRELEARNLFIVPVMGTVGIYRYHHLFQAFLRRQVAARRGEAELLRLHGLAAQIYEGLGDLPEAVEHYIQGREYVRAAALMAEQAEGALKALRHDVVRGWLDRLPHELHEREPDVIFVRAQLAGWAGQYDILSTLCRRLLDLYDQRGDYSGLTRALAWTAARFWKLRNPYFDAVVQRWLDHPAPEVRIYGRMLQAFTRTRRGEWGEAFTELEQLLGEIPPATRAYFYCLELLAMLAFWRGDGRTSLKYGIPYTVGRTALGDFTWGIHNWMSYCFAGDPLGLEQYHRQYMALEIPPAMGRLHQLVGLLGEGIMHLYHRRWEEALACFEALRPSFADDTAGFRTLGTEATFTARLEMADICARLGRREDARSYLRQNLDLAAGYPEVQATAHAAFAQFLVEEGDPVGARGHLSRAIAIDPPGLDGITTISIAVAAARLAQFEGDRAEARRAMSQALAITTERGCPWLLLHKGGPEILPLIADLARNPLPGGAGGHAVYALIGGMGDQAVQFLAPLLAHADPAVKSAAFALLDHLQHGGAQQRVPVLKVHALGPLRAARYDQPVDSPEWKRTKVKALLIMLLLRRGKALPKESAMALLWPDAPPATARNNLRATVHGLKRVLEPELGPGAASRFIRSDRESVALGCLEDVWFDLWAFDDLVLRARSAQRSGRADEALELLQGACELSRGPFLPEDA
ncbi:MAG: transcriptional regulator, partial [Firmicutes bacterium]|nr:transcriptional regulator [Bacillota bacterium]